MRFPDHYLALGVTPQAGPEEIRRAYLQVMRETHPDRRPDDWSAQQAARAANVAWEVLGDPARRAAYDRLRQIRDARVVGSAPLRDEPPAPPAPTARRRYAAAVRRRSLRVAAAVFGASLILLVVSST